MQTLIQDSAAAAEPDSADGSCRVQVLVVVEGINDVQFLRRISRIIHASDAAYLDLAEMEAKGRLIFLPVGGSHLSVWSRRLAPLGIGEFYLFDRDVSPLTEEHREIVDAVNRRPGCIAALTGKRNTENYLHPEAVFKAREVRVEFGPDDDLPEIAARRSYELFGGKHRWEDIPFRRQRQMKYRAKHWLNRDAVEAMTVDLLAEQDPDGDVRSWLEAIAWLAQQR